MRYDTPEEWQGNREEYLWCIEQYINWLAPPTRYGCITEWTAWAVPAMFTRENIDVLHNEDALHRAYDEVMYMAWNNVTRGDEEEEYESDDASFPGSNWDTAPTGEPEGEPATSLAVDQGTLSTWVQWGPIQDA